MIEFFKEKQENSALYRSKTDTIITIFMFLYKL